MAGSDTTAKRQTRLRIDLAKKVKNERKLVIELRPFFNKINSDFRRVYRASGTIIDVSVYDDELRGILINHYKRVQDDFKTSFQREIRKYFNQSVLEYKQNLAQDIQQNLDFYAVQHSQEQTQIINQTNQDQLQESVNKAQLTLAENQQEANDRSVAAVAGLNFSQLTTARSNTIGLTETQNLAESTKDIEAEVIIAAGIIIAGIALNQTNIDKTWSSVLDDVTRSSHAEADDQQRPQNEPFLVQGQFLQYPGDTSLGASKSNVMNCRCNTTRIITPLGEREGAIPLSELPGAIQPRA